MIEPRSEYDFGTAAIELAYHTTAPAHRTEEAKRRRYEFILHHWYDRPAKLARLDRNHIRANHAQTGFAVSEADGRALYRRDMVKAMRDVFKCCPVHFRTMRVMGI